MAADDKTNKCVCSRQTRNHVERITAIARETTKIAIFFKQQWDEGSKML
jgi:hypothetical protein